MICPKDDAADCCGLCHYKPVVVIATHGRKEITTLNIKTLKDQSIIPQIVVVCSDQDEFRYYKELGVTVLLEPNRPLGRKWQIGVNIAYNMGANPLIIVGSDDLLSKGYIKRALEKLKEGFHFVGCTAWYSYDVKSMTTYQSIYTNLNKDFPIGSGKVYSRLILDACRAKIFDVNAEKKLDDLGHKNSVKFNQFLIRTPEILAVKGRWTTLNPVDKYIGARNINTKRANIDMGEKFGLKVVFTGEKGNSFDYYN